VEAAVGSPWEAAGSHTAGVGEGRSRAVAGIGLGEGFCSLCVSRNSLFAFRSVS